jgi:hypothetical protein
MQTSYLSEIEAVRFAIEAASTVQEIKETLDAATAAKVYAEQAKLGKDIQLQIAEYIVRAERKLGEILQAAKVAGQITKTNTLRRDHVIGEDMITFTLEEAGVSRNLSSRAQKISAIPQESFEKKVTELKESGKLTPNTIVRSCRQANGQKPDSAPKPHYRQNEIVAFHDNGLSNSQNITPDMLSLTAKQKLERAIRQEKERLGRSFREVVAQHKAAMNQQVDTEIKGRLENISERWQAEQDQAKRIMNARRGFMPKRIFRLIISCLHPDKFDQIN